MLLRTCSVFLTLIFVVVGSALAVPPWQLLNFKKIDADPTKSYEVTPKSGPWMIMAATFTGETAQKEAHDLVLDLRKNHKVNAYVHAKAFGQREREKGLGLMPDGRERVMVPLKNALDAVPSIQRSANFNGGRTARDEFMEYAVLIGDYPAIDDADAQKTLKEIKVAQPVSLKSAQGLSAANLTKQIKKVSEGVTVNKNRPPLARAFMAPNPLLPQEYFTQKQGVDKFVLEMNKDAQYSLLKCPGRYTVQVATFKGAAIIDQKKINDVEKQRADLKTNLDKAADKAHTLATALRSATHKEEAYEFHDRDQSIVTIGSFDSLGVTGADGRLILDPAVQRIVNKYGVKQATDVINEIDPKSGKRRDVAKSSMQGMMIGKIVLDVTPTPIEAPKRSIAADYVRQ